jgi:membrane fusion protein, copper/silver efflux system
MKKIMLTLAMAAFAIIFIAVRGTFESKTSTSGKDSTVHPEQAVRNILYWYDPMNPTIHFDHPGKSPMMDMDLVPKYADEGEGNSDIVNVDPAMVQDMGIVTGMVKRRKLTKTIHSYGVVSPDEKTIRDISTKVSGWIEKLFFNYSGMTVKRGQEMAVMYSPDLIAAEQEFLQSITFAKSSIGARGDASVFSSNQIINSSREKLKFFGMNDHQINDLQSTGKVIDKVIIHSPSNGTILDKNIFEGQWISAGQTLFRVADLSRVWVLADVFKIDAPFLTTGSPATVSFNGKKFGGHVDFIDPEIDPNARSMKARIELFNPGLALKIGEYVDASIHSLVSYDALSVPAQSVINTGLRQVVAVALGSGRFELRDVKLGAYADGYFQILDGLKEGESIVISGQFLIDSDANLKNAGAALTAGMNMADQAPNKIGPDSVPDANK